MLGIANNDVRARKPGIELETEARVRRLEIHGDLSAVETARQELQVPDSSPRCEYLNTPVLFDQALPPLLRLHAAAHG